MLTIQQFKGLSQQEQLIYVWEQCLFLESRPEKENHLVKLYLVGMFFVEIRFSGPDQFQIIHAFENTDLLLPYVAEIDLSELLH